PSATAVTGPPRPSAGSAVPGASTAHPGPPRAGWPHILQRSSSRSSAPPSSCPPRSRRCYCPFERRLCRRNPGGGIGGGPLGPLRGNERFVHPVGADPSCGDGAPEREPPARLLGVGPRDRFQDPDCALAVILLDLHVLVVEVERGARDVVVLLHGGGHAA